MGLGIIGANAGITALQWLQNRQTAGLIAANNQRGTDILNRSGLPDTGNFINQANAISNQGQGIINQFYDPNSVQGRLAPVWQGAQKAQDLYSSGLNDVSRLSNQNFADINQRWDAQSGGEQTDLRYRGLGGSTISANLANGAQRGRTADLNTAYDQRLQEQLGVRNTLGVNAANAYTQAAGTQFNAQDAATQNRIQGVNTFGMLPFQTQQGLTQSGLNFYGPQYVIPTTSPYQMIQSPR